MSLIALGINHNTASLELREKLAFLPSEIEGALADARNSADVDELAILSTCNRTELYAYADLADNALLSWLAQFKHLDVDSLKDAHYMWRNTHAVRHMMSVASGFCLLYTSPSPRDRG